MEFLAASGKIQYHYSDAKLVLLCNLYPNVDFRGVQIVGTIVFGIDRYY